MKVDADILESLDYPSDDSDREQDSARDGKKHKNLLKEISQISGVKTKKLKKSSRNEASREFAESNWTSGKDASDKLDLSDLIGSLKSTSAPVAKIKKKLNNAESTKVLKTPLHKPQADRIARGVSYKKTVNEVSKWETTVIKNRDADQLTFPLQEYKPPPVSSKTIMANHRPQNDLEREIAAVLKGSAPLLERKDKELTEAEEKALKSFGLEEAMDRRKELQKARALQSYYEAKCRRVRKIKSKKFHRVARKEQEKLTGKIDLDELAKTDPELFKAELQKAERMRAMERANLRHRNTSKWAKNLITRGNKSKDDMENIREQLRISRALTDHKTVGPDSDNDDDEDSKMANGPAEGELNLLYDDDSATKNPWLLGDSNVEQKEQQEKASCLHLTRLQPVTNKEVDEQDINEGDDEVSSGDEWEGGDDEEAVAADKKKQKKKKKSAKKTKPSTVPVTDESATDARDLTNNVLLTNTDNDAGDVNDDIDLVIDNDTAKDDVDFNVITNDDIDLIVDQVESGEEAAVDKQEEKPKKKKKTKKVKNTDNTASAAKPKKLTKKQREAAQVADVNKKLDVNNDDGPGAVDFSANADAMDQAEDAFDEMNNDVMDGGLQDDNAVDDVQQMHIREAFASDDVVSEFIKDKAADIEDGKPKAEDNVLPGWGDWAGGGLKVSKKKKRQFTKKPTEQTAARKDANLSNVIISEKKNKGLAKIQVSNVPFPYTSKEEFERSLRQPIGPQWNTPSTVAKLTEPRIRTTAGHVIDPLKPSGGQKRSWKNADNHNWNQTKKKKKKKDKMAVD